jgi:SAM-dependent methyltransferase
VQRVAAELARHPDRLRWNAKYSGAAASFEPHPLAVRALADWLPEGPVADLACGPSGSALLAAAAGRCVTAVDVSDVALGALGREARRRGLGDLLTLVHADLAAWRPQPRRYALVLCTGYWDRAVFATAAQAVAPGGLLGWEAFTAAARQARPGLPAEWCLRPGEPACLLGAGFEVCGQDDMPDGERGAKRRLLARRRYGTRSPAAVADP